MGETEKKESIFIEETLDQRVENIAGIMDEIDVDQGKLRVRVAEAEGEVAYIKKIVEGLLSQIQTIKVDAANQATAALDKLLRGEFSEAKLAELLATHVLTVRNASRQEVHDGKAIAVKHVR